MIARIKRTARITLVIIISALLLGRSVVEPGDKIERVRAYTRQIEFDYVAWTIDALMLKLNQYVLSTGNYLSPEQERQAVLEYLDIVAQIQRTEASLNAIYANPEIEDPNSASREVRANLASLYERRSKLGPLAESIMQNQLAVTIDELGLTAGGQPLPPILYHSTPPPMALIVSPRDAIRQDADISLQPDMTVNQQEELESSVDRQLNVSSLVVGIGGVGLYPTMVMQTSSLNWLSEVVAHEWIHNFLTLRPLGLNYFTTPELRTMNETVASIAGKEIGTAMMTHYYPDLLPPPPPENPPTPETESSPEQEPIFDFRAEMHETRVTVDKLLEEGKIDEAEEYMEARRVVFWENGYRLRKINQAYFAFYGAYADQPGGAAGEDPVGAAVRALRAHSVSLAEFLEQIAWMSSYQELEDRVAGTR